MFFFFYETMIMIWLDVRLIFLKTLLVSECLRKIQKLRSHNACKMIKVNVRITKPKKIIITFQGTFRKKRYHNVYVTDLCYVSS